jgi:hypothetical protein
MVEWLTAHWVTLISLLFGGGTVSALIRYGPGLLAVADCVQNLSRCREQRQDLVEEVALVRRQVGDLRGDVDRLLAHSVASGAVSDPATVTENLTTIPRPISGT